MGDLCSDCGQPMLPPGEVKRPNEYDHASGCPKGWLPKLTKAQVLSLHNAAGEGYGATGSGMTRTASALKVLGLVSVCPFRRWVTLTEAGRAHLLTLQPSSPRSDGEEEVVNGRASCPTCSKLIEINLNRSLRAHGQLNQRCPGRGTPPRCPECESDERGRLGTSYVDSRGNHDHMNAYICWNAWHRSPSNPERPSEKK